MNGLEIDNSGTHLIPRRLCGWSGWHGGWRFADDGDLQAVIHYAGDMSKAQLYTFTKVGGKGYMFWQREVIWMVAGMTTLHFTQRQLDDEWWLWV